MASITSAGVGSGLDINGIINQLMALERRPLNVLQNKEAAARTQLSAYGTLKSAISTFQGAMQGLSSASKFKVYGATPEDDSVFTATADSSAAAGTYNVEVVQLAVAHQRNSQRYADKDTTTVGNAGDVIHVQIGTDNAFEVAIGGKTLAEIRDDINAAADNVGVTATIVPDYDTGTSTEYYRLVLTSNETGTSNQLTLSFEDSLGGAIADPMGFSELRAAKDAMLKVEGYLAVRASNTVTDVIEGVSLDLKAVTATGVTRKLTVSRDTAAITESVNSFVTAYNDLNKTIKNLRSGDLKGDLTLLSIESGMLGVLNTPPSGLTTSLKYLSEVGVSIQKDGTMALDSSQLETQLAADFNGVSELFANDSQGYAFRLEALAGDYLTTDGVIDAREDGLNSRIDDLDDREAAMEVRLEIVEKRLRSQFSALDALLGQMQGTSSFLTRQLSNL
jgi:flagellar hook-associated protein 2